MRRFAAFAAALVAASSCSGPAFAEDAMVCDREEVLLSKLHAYSDQRVAQTFDLAEGARLRVLKSPDGYTFSVLATDRNGLSCALFVGGVERSRKEKLSAK